MRPAAAYLLVAGILAFGVSGEPASASIPFAASAVPPGVVRSARTPIDASFVADPWATPKRVFQPDWAGPVLFAPDARPLKIPEHRFSVVEGAWFVPSVRPTINCSNPYEQTDGASIWIALDGWMSTFYAHAKKDGKWYRYPSTDILQAGSESDVPCYDGGPPRKYATRSYFWIEWGGVRNIMVERHHRNLVLRPGDRIYVRIAADTTGTDAWRRATVWFVDESSGFYLPPRTFHSGCVDCGTPFQRPAYLFGNTAEWIVEATFYSAIKPSLPNTLADFGDVAMDDAFVTDQDDLTYAPGAPLDATPNIDWMTWNGVPLRERGTLLACATLSGSSTVAFARAPYVIATPGQQGRLEPKPQRCT